jgi:hypothetical protein
MSPIKEPSSAKIPEKSQQTPEKLFEKIRVKGHMDLSQFSPDEQKKLYTWYSESKEALPQNDRVEFLEQCVAQEIIDDKTLLTHIQECKKNLEEPEDDESYNVAQKSLRALGEYLAYVKNPTYLQSLWQCYHEIPYETRRELEEYCTKENQKLAILVAPFVDMSKFRVLISKKIGEQTIKRINTAYHSGGMRVIHSRSTLRREQNETEQLFIDTFFKYSQDAQPTIDALLAYCAQDAHLFSDSPAIENLRAMNKLFLFPYLKRIQEQGLDTLIFPKERHAPWNITEKGSGAKNSHPFRHLFDREYIPYSNPENFLTRKEREEVKRIKRVFIKQNPKIAERLESDTSGFLAIQENLHPENLRRKLMQIHDDGKIRAIKNLLTGFHDYKHLLSQEEQRAYLLECLEKNNPIFSCVELLHLPKDAIADLFKKATRQAYGFPLNDLYTNADIRALLAYNAQHPGEPDIEDLMVKILVRDITEKKYCQTLEQIVQYTIQDIFPCFSEKNQRKITDAITKYTPHIWNLNIPYAINHNVLPFHAILNSLDHYTILADYQKILYHTHLLEQEQKNGGITPADIRSYAKDIILAHPNLFFDYPQIVKENFTESEQRAFIESRLTPPVNQNFFYELNNSPYKDTYKIQCKDILLHSPDLIEYGISRYNGIPILIELIGMRALIDYIIHHTDTIDHEHVFSNTETLTAFFQSKRDMATLYRKIERTQSYNLYITLLDSIQSRISSFHYAKRERRKIPDDIPLQRLEEIQKELIARLNNACDAQPHLIFHAHLLTIQELNPYERINAHIETYISQNPHKLLNHSWRETAFTYEKIVGDDVFSLLIHRYARELAFSKNLDFEYLKKISQDHTLRKELSAINPLIDIHCQEKLDMDFYDRVLLAVSDYAFFPLYKASLTDIANNEKELFGTQHTPKDITVQEYFLTLIRKISLLEQCDFAKRNADAILSLPTKDREDILSLLEFLALYTLDTDIDGDFQKDSLDTIKRSLRKRMTHYIEETFTITLYEQSLKGIEHISIDTLQALVIYYKKTCSHDLPMKKAFHEFFSHVIDGTYAEWKMPARENLPSLKEKKLIPHRMTQEQYSAWTQEDTLNLEEVLRYDIESVHYGVRKILEQAIADGHMEKDILFQPAHELQNQYEKLTQTLQNLTARQKQIQTFIKQNPTQESAELKEEYEEIKRSITDYMHDHRVELARIKGLQYLYALQTISARDLEEQILTTHEKKRVPFSEIFKTLRAAFHDEFPNFSHDIARIQSELQETRQSLFQGSRISKTKLFITDRTDVATATLIGEKPVPSCQHFDGTHTHNRGLLSYLSDPNVKIIQVYNEQGVIIARSILRLMSTVEGNPALYAERVYSVNTHPKITEAITTYVDMKARAMGVPYFTSEINTAESQILFQNGSRSPFVYTDDGGGLVRHGIFEITPMTVSKNRFKGPEEKNAA